VTLVFYISGHGFGHASRQVEVINAIGRLRPSLATQIRSAVSPSLLARTVTVPYSLVETATDTGIVQVDSVTHDDLATLEAARSFYRSYDERVRHEVASLPKDTRVIIGDIPPLAFSVAAALDVPSVAIANFTWDWIYDTHPGVDAEPCIGRAAREAYGLADLALELPFSGGFDVFPRREAIPLIARQPTRTREDTRRFFDLPAERPVALLSFGGYGLPALDLTRLDCLDEWTIVTTDRVSEAAAAHPAITRIVESRFQASGFRYEDLVAAADVVVTKPGYGIIAECATAGTAMLYTSRGEFREYDVLVAALPRYVRSRFISQAALFAGRWRDALAALAAQAAPTGRLAANGADAAAQRISELAN
jgi:L-arabinokinase